MAASVPVMAELCIRVENKVNATSLYLDVQCLKLGDVVAIQPDGWSWGTSDLTSPMYRILALPGLAPEDLSAYLAPEPELDPLHPSRTLQRRAFRFDFVAYGLLQSPLFRSRFADDRRAIAILQPPDATLPTALAAKVARIRVIDPGVIG